MTESILLKLRMDLNGNFLPVTVLALKAADESGYHPVM
jgi:hypothetical protein